jgi:pimeloyl-ACP methyl ester carboxylesterase
MDARQLGPAVTGDRFDFSAAGSGRMTCYVAGAGRPLLLVHSINAAASVDEVRPLFEHYRASRRVFAPDLPGFGLSERSDRAYSPRLYTDALHATVAEIQARCGNGPIDALAVSLGCEFLARAALEQPAHFGRLALVSPTGFRGGTTLRGAPGSTRKMAAVYALLSQPLWAGGLFRLLTRPPVVRYFLRRAWGRAAIDEQAWAYAVASTAQPGAEHAPLHFLGGGLFSADIQAVYESLTQPVWMSHGVRGDFTDYSAKTIVQGRPNWRISVFDSGALPYFEDLRGFVARYDAFLAGHDPGS